MSGLGNEPRVAIADGAELARVLRILLGSGGVPRLGPASSGGGFLEQRAPHALAVRRAAVGGDAAEVVRLDRALPACATGCAAGAELLARRRGARHLPVLRRFAGEVEAGRAAGHFATVLALHAVEFSVGALPLLQALLWCEQRGESGDCGDAKMGAFLRESAAALPALLEQHESTGNRFSIFRR